jgi:hypothetical protein
MQKQTLTILLTALIVVTALGGVFALPGTAQAGGGTDDICVKDNAMTTTTISAQVVRETFRQYHARLKGIGSTVSMTGISGSHTHVIIWVLLHYDAVSDQYTVRVLNVVTGCNG